MPFDLMPIYGHVAQVDGCNKDLASEKEYYQRYRICEEHLKLSSLLKDGVQQRFCQQCGRFHLLADFDGDKRWVLLRLLGISRQWSMLCAPSHLFSSLSCWLQWVLRGEGS